MAKPLTSWLVPSFLQHNLHPVVMGRCLHASVTKFQDKFTSLRQVNSPNSWEKFQICCTDMLLTRFLLNFTVFCMFLRILQLCDSAKYQKPWRWAASFTLYKLATKNLNLATIFLQLVAKGNLRIFLILSPAHGHTHLLKQLSLISQGKTYFNRLNMQLRWRTCS